METEQGNDYVPPENMLKLEIALGSQHVPSVINGSHDFLSGRHEIHPTIALPALVRFTEMMTNQMKYRMRRPLVIRSIVRAKEVLLHDEAVMENVDAIL
jgi:hypothetical protein